VDRSIDDKQHSIERWTFSLRAPCHRDHFPERENACTMTNNDTVVRTIRLWMPVGDVAFCARDVALVTGPERLSEERAELSFLVRQAKRHSVNTIERKTSFVIEEL
jgi:hypothetical protein